MKKASLWLITEYICNRTDKSKNRNIREKYTKNGVNKVLKQLKSKITYVNSKFYQRMFFFI